MTFFNPPSLAFIYEWLASKVYDRHFPWNSFPNGTTAFFLRITEDWGLKLFYRRNRCEFTSTILYDAESNRRLQNRLAELGLAPAVGPMVTDFRLGNCVFNGFWTRVADVPEWELKYAMPGCPILADYMSLKKALQKFGMSHDLHDENIGYCDGRLMVIDVSHSSETSGDKKRFFQEVA